MEQQQKDERRGVIQINVDFSCQFNCESCERFFQCKSDEKLKIFDRRRMSRVKDTMARIKRKVAICAGKGGVGKSLFTANLATALALRGRKVSVLDHDFDGSTIPRMLGILGKRLLMGRRGIIPAEADLGIQVVAMSLIVAEDDVTTWYHSLRRNATEEFLSHVDYGDRDYLLVDLPPGTSSDAVNLMEYIPNLDGMVVVTNPTGVSQIVARRATIMALESGVKVLGIIENMSGYVCTKCHATVDILKRGGGEELARECDVPFLGRIPLDPRVSYCSDAGRPYVSTYPDSPATMATLAIADTIEAALGWKDQVT